ncbi:MAG TPA: hypothetical protein VIS48_08560 [Candidatus Kryptonia bacterium]
MGSTSLLDILGSLVIGGLLLLVALRMNSQATMNTYSSQASLTVQQNMTAIIQNIEWDFRKIGYCKNPMLTSDPTHYILKGKSDSISFIADLYNSGTANTVSWYLGSYVGPNPRVRKLCRKVDGGAALEANLGVTQFSMIYFGASGDTIVLPYSAGDSVTPQLIELTLRVEPTVAYDTAYTQSYSYWRQTRLVSRNLKMNR